MVWRNADGVDQGGAPAPSCGHCSGLHNRRRRRVAANVSLLLSLLSIVLIMKLFYQFELHFGMRASSPLSVIGANTIAIYTTHRILVAAVQLNAYPQNQSCRLACIRGAGPATGVSVRLSAAVHPVWPAGA